MIATEVVVGYILRRWIVAKDGMNDGSDDGDVINIDIDNEWGRRVGGGVIMMTGCSGR